MKKILGIVFGCFALIGVALFFILPGWYIGGAVFAVIVIITAIITSLKKKFETKCSKCKKAYDYDTDVSWRLIKRWVKSAPSNSNTLARSYFLYDITCKCSDCGTQKRYRKKIEGPSINDKGELHAVDPEFVLEDNFDQSQEVTWGAIFLCLVMGVAFIAGGLLFGGQLGDMLNEMDINVPGITQGNEDNDISNATRVEMGEDPADYYGTYYGSDDGNLIIFVIDAEKCSFTMSNGLESENEVYEYDYASAEYIQAYWPNSPVSPSLLLYTTANRDRAIVWSVAKTEDGYELVCDDMHVKTDVLTLSDLMNDPKDYYGTYRMDSFYVTLGEDGTATMDIGEGEQKYPYFYADGNYVKKSFGKNYSAAIIVNVGNGNAYPFKYENGELTLSDQYTFVK